MKININKLIGNRNNLKLEDRLYNIISLMGIFLFLYASIINFILDFHEVTIILPIICAIIQSWLYNLSINKKIGNAKLIITYSMLIFVFIPIIWITSGGLEGGISYFVIFIAITIPVLSKKKIRYFFILSIIFITILLIILSQIFPQTISTYNSNVNRTIDIIFSIIIALIISLILSVIISDSYYNERNKVISHLEKLKKAQGTIIKLEKIHSVIATTVTVNHEIRQPLTTLKGYFEILQTKLEKDNLNDSQIKTMKKIGESIDLIEAILEKYKKAGDVSFDKYLKGKDMAIIK